MRLYESIIRPLLFRLAPERIHHIIANGLRITGYIPLGNRILRSMFAYRGNGLEREVFGIKFPNPVGLAAGFDKNAEYYNELSALGFGFVEIGTVTPRPQPGNPKPRLFRLPKDQALINRMGFNNHGVEKAAANLRRRGKSIVIGGNLGKNTLTANENAPADYLKLFRSLYQYVDYFTVNVSCPNVSDMAALQNSESISEIIEPLLEFRRGQDSYRPILLKLSPDLDRKEIDDILSVVIERSLDGIVATNTTLSREGLAAPASMLEKIGHGGVSGRPLTERSIEMVRYIHEKTEGRFPIIGVGGIMTPEDAERMLAAGASLIQVYTGFIYRGPNFVKHICKHLSGRCSRLDAAN